MLRRGLEKQMKGARRGPSGKARDIRRPGSLAEFGGILRRRREELGMTLDGLMAKTGISKPYLSNIETGRSPGPASEEKLRRVAGALGLSAEEVVAGGDWLRTPESVRKMVERSGQLPVGSGQVEGEVPRRADGAIDLDAAVRGERGIQNSEFRIQKEEGIRKEEGGIPLRAVPLINRVAAGRAAEYTDLDYPRGVADQYVPVPDLPEAPVGSAFALKVVGDSMAPEYVEGEIVIVGPAGEGESAVKDGDDCVVRLGEAENFATTFKRVFFVVDGEGRATGVRLVALNAKYAERVVGMERVSGIYRLIYRMRAARRGEGRNPSECGAE